MRFSFAQPVSTFLKDTGYVALPAKAFKSEKSYTSECPLALEIPPITVIAKSYSFVSQSNADSLALSTAMASALLKRTLAPCPDPVI
jgi:hypothetical protein